MARNDKMKPMVDGSGARVLEALSEIHEMEAVLSANKISLTDFLKLVAKLLSQAGIEFAVAGGLARSIHAAPRMTVALDVVVAAKDHEKAFKELLNAGFREADRLEYQKPNRVITKFTYLGREIDILDFPKQHDLVNFLLSSSIKQPLAGIPYSFVGLEGLLVTKLCSFRHKDKGDLDDLKKAAPIDLDVVKSWCGRLGIMDRFAFMALPPED